MLVYVRVCSTVMMQLATAYINQSNSIGRCYSFLSRPSCLIQTVMDSVPDYVRNRRIIFWFPSYAINFKNLVLGVLWFNGVWTPISTYVKSNCNFIIFFLCYLKLSLQLCPTLSLSFPFFRII